MVKPICFLKPAWCGNHFAGLRPGQGLQPATGATALSRWFSLNGGARLPDAVRTGPGRTDRLAHSYGSGACDDAGLEFNSSGASREPVGGTAIMASMTGPMTVPEMFKRRQFDRYPQYKSARHHGLSSSRSGRIAPERPAGKL